MTNTPDIPNLEVSDTVWGEISPTAARIHVVLAGDKLFSGRAALQKAEELRRLCAALDAVGVPESQVALSGVSIDVSSGLFTRSSSVTYRVRITLTDLDRIASTLDAIADAKKATLTHIEWDYAGAAGEQNELLATCASRAAAKAKALAAALGVSLAGIRSVREEDLAEGGREPAPMMFGAPGAAVPRSRQSISSELAGLDLAPKKRVGVCVRLQYGVGPV